MAKWRTIRVGELGHVITGKTPPTIRTELFGIDYPFITPTDIDAALRNVTTERFLSKDGRAFQRNLLLPSGAICFVSIGATIGKICITSQPSFTNQQINSIIVDDSQNDARFVYYLLRHEAENIKGIAGGAATPIVNKSSFAGYRVTVPELETQKKIGSLLSAYDDLIENNTRRIKILEKMVQSIYREWFVHFRFPGHEKVKLVESPLGKIPQGWQAKILGDILELAYGKALKAEQRMDGPYPVYGSSGVVGLHNEALVKGPGVIVGRKGNVGSVFWSDDDFYPIDTVFFVRSELPLHYVFYNLKHQKFLNNDAAVPGLNRNAAYMKPFIVSDSGTLATFQSFAEPIFKLLRLLSLRNANLCRTRDLLLSRLISGEMSVEDIEIVK